MFSPLTKQLIDTLRCLPGIGPKSAQRMAFALLSESGKAKGLALASALTSAIEKIGYCQQCRNFTEEPVCHLCNNPKRNQHVLCVVESPADVAAIEQTHSYNGLYFVLHGHLSPLDGVGPKDIGIPILVDKLNRSSVNELIIATNPTIEGKATAHYIASHVDQNTIKCSRIAHGVPIGGEIEYLDGGTLTHAFHSRIPMNDNKTEKKHEDSHV